MGYIRNFLFGIIISATILSLSGCATSTASPKGSNPFTSGQVSLTLKKGITTKAEVARVFGAPNIVTQNGSTTTWIYQKNAQVARSNSKGIFGTVLLLSAGENSASNSESSRTMTLIIKFNKHDKVQSFKSMTTSF